MPTIVSFRARLNCVWPRDDVASVDGFSKLPAFSKAHACVRALPCVVGASLLFGLGICEDVQLSLTNVSSLILYLFMRCMQRKYQHIANMT